MNTICFVEKFSNTSKIQSHYSIYFKSKVILLYAGHIAHTVQKYIIDRGHKPKGKRPFGRHVEMERQYKNGSKEFHGRAWTLFIWLKIETSVGPPEHGNKPSCFIKFREFLRDKELLASHEKLCFIN
jgi:hypothetical protein